jgi:iron(III) transport system ATP-binding protein
MIAGFEQPSQGRLVFDGRVVEDLGVHIVPEKRGMGFVFQDLALFPHLRVLDNVMFGLFRLPRERRRERAMDMLEAVRLAEYAGRYPQELSGGEQQRVALARTLAPSPQLVLLDEPFANLDPTLRDDLRADVRDIIKREKITAVLVTHDHGEAVLFADRIGVMCEGRLEQVGEASELYQQPRTAFVSEFFGASSILKAKVLERTKREASDDGDSAERPGI